MIKATMNKYVFIIIVSLILLCQEAVSSEVERSEIEQFIPKGYVLFDTICGDLNKDGFNDCVVIIKATKKRGIVENRFGDTVDRNRRGVLILFNKKDHYELVLKNYNCFSSENEDGGVYFAPDLWLRIHKCNLFVHYGHGRYGYWEYTFRYRNSDFELIGYDAGEMRGPTIESLTSINYLTKKKIIETNINANEGDENEEVFEKTETKIKVSKLRKLSTIKDFDELGYEVVANN